jgi:predicted trehalose synthase
VLNASQLVAILLGADKQRDGAIQFAAVDVLPVLRKMGTVLRLSFESEWLNGRRGSMIKQIQSDLSLLQVLIDRGRLALKYQKRL